MDDIAAVLEVLAQASLPPSLKILGLAGALDEDDFLASIRAHSSRLSELEKLALPLGDEVSSEVDEAARKLVPTLCDSNEFERLMLPQAYKDW